MNDQADIDRTAARLRAALSAAADVMAVNDAPETPATSAHSAPAARPAQLGPLAPLAAAAGIVVIAARTVIGAHLASPSGTHAGSAAGTNRPRACGRAHRPRPEFYLTVRTRRRARTSCSSRSGAPTAARSPARRRSLPQRRVGGYLAPPQATAPSTSREYPCTTTAIPHTTFDRITITNSGRISGFAPAGLPVKGMVTAFAVSPDGSQVAYNALPGVPAPPARFRSPAAGRQRRESVHRRRQDLAGHEGRRRRRPTVVGAGRPHADRRRSPARPRAGPDGPRAGPASGGGRCRPTARPCCGRTATAPPAWRRRSRARRAA